MSDFLDENLSKYHLIFSKLGMCIDVVEIWFGIVHILSIFDSYQPRKQPYFRFSDDNLSKY